MMLCEQRASSSMANNNKKGPVSGAFSFQTKAWLIGQQP
jgi:hypothetical protein